MRPSFNTAGPCVPGEHYMLPPERRLGRVMELIDDGKYFTLHAGRQTGKTTSARWLVDHLNAQGRLACIWVDLQTARELPELPEAALTLLECLDHAVLRVLSDVGLPADRDRFLANPRTAVLRYLRDLAARTPRPLVILFDEADGLVGATLVSFLTQLRDGYIDRSTTPFPYSMALMGQRAVRDYALTQEDRRTLSWLGTASPFNITAEAATLVSFTSAETEELLLQHTATTGQRFEPGAVALVFELSQGHPWLVNALADRVVERDVRDRSVVVTTGHVEAAKESLILERRTHIDSLTARLREPRVRRILDPMLAGERASGDTLDDDLAYVAGLGLIAKVCGMWHIANPIYREVIPRALVTSTQEQLDMRTSWYVRPDGSLDIPKLMAAWQVFWRKDGHLAAEGFGYRESGPHLMLMAFLQRILNGGGTIHREYSLGKGALDLLVEWRVGASVQRVAIELKLRRDTETEEEALEQVVRYLRSLGLGEGWLVMFDLRKELSWAEKLTTRTHELEGCKVHVVGC